MLLFLLPDGTADSVKMVFDYLELGLGYDTFRRLFPVILTDNGSEFKRVDDLELNEDLIFRTSLFYCDPMASWQKPHIEKNHEYIRYVVPKGKSFTPYQQEDITLLMNHINSTKRFGLKGKAPYELIEDDDEDMYSDNINAATEEKSAMQDDDHHQRNLSLPFIFHEKTSEC